MGGAIIGDIRHVLEKYNTPLEIKDENFEDFCQKIDQLIHYFRNPDRDSVEDAVDIGRKLRSLGAPMEAYKILKAEAEVFKNNKMYREYWHRRYFSFAFAALGYPTDAVEMDLRQDIEELKVHREFFPFLPLFLNILGSILHIYEKKYREANDIYEEALASILSMQEDEFENVTIDRKYHWAVRLIINNYIDSLFHIEDRTEKEEKRLLDLFELLKTQEEGTFYTVVLSQLNLAEYYAYKGDKRYQNVLRKLHHIKDKELVRYIVPASTRIKAIYYSRVGNFKKSLVLILESLKKSEYYGNTLEETALMGTAMDIFKRVTAQLSAVQKRKFFTDTPIFKYFLKVQAAKDTYLGKEHAKNVSILARRLGEILGLDGEELEILEFAGLLHDVGKLYIPWFTLNKITPLDDEDWEIIKVHPVKGAEILENLGMRHEAKAVRNHHERVDGSGYPFGKSELNILDEIVGISDLFDAAISPSRRYKAHKSKDELIKELLEREPFKFSAVILNALKQAVDRGLV